MAWTTVNYLLASIGLAAGMFALGFAIGVSRGLRIVGDQRRAQPKAGGRL